MPKKLPRGMGGYSYEKMVTLGTEKINGENVSVTGSSISEVNKRMKEKEADWIDEIKEQRADLLRKIENRLIS